MTDGWGLFCEIAFKWISQDLIDDKSTLVQVKARCRQATSHYLSQCWPKSLLLYGFTRPQWVNNELVLLQKMAWHQTGDEPLTHWGRVTHICVSKPTIIGSDNGLSPGRRQAITWTNAGLLLIGPLGTNFSVILIEIYTFSFKKMHLKMSSAKWRLFRLGLNELTSLATDTSLTLNQLTHWGHNKIVNIFQMIFSNAF